MEKLYSLIDQLNEKLAVHPKVTTLDKIEQLLENDKEVISLVKEKDEKETKYNESLRHFSFSSKEVEKARHELFIAKEKLDSHPIVREYLSAYKAVKELYRNIHKIIFKDIKIISCPKI